MKTTILAAALAASCALAHGAIIGSTGVAPPPVATAPASAASGVDPAVAARRAADAAALKQAGALIQAHEPQAAIERVLDPLIAAREAEVRDSQATIYCANTPAESLVYLIPAAHEKKAAIVVDGTLCNAYFMRGFAEVDLGKLDEAEAVYHRCLEIDPNDQKARGELGYVLNLRAKQIGLGK